MEELGKTRVCEAVSPAQVVWSQKRERHCKKVLQRIVPTLPLSLMSAPPQQPFTIAILTGQCSHQSRQAWGGRRVLR